MKALRAIALLFTITALFQSAAAQTNDRKPVETVTLKAMLDRVVIVERHGVRPPTKAPEALAKFAEQPWPQWSVPPGELTAHGGEAMSLMGAALKRYYAKEGLLNEEGCPDGLFVWSDSADQRTRASGDAIVKGFGCQGPSQHLEAGKVDALIDPIEAGICPVDPEKGKAALAARLPVVLEPNRAAYEKARQTMQSILTPNGCGKEGERACTVSEGEDQAVIKNGEARLEGPLANASGLTENLLLEYSEGKPLSEVGWGRAAGKLSDVLTLHNLYTDIARSEPYMASRRGSLLAQEVLDLLDNKQSRFKGAAPVPQKAKLVVFLGHDTNLSNMEGFLGTSWDLKDQPDSTPPGAALAFERWIAADGKVFVRVRLFYQTIEETRTLRKIETPQSVTLPICSKGECSLAAFKAKISENLSQDCLK